MHSLRPIKLVLPHATPGPSHRSGSDPLIYSSNLNVPDLYYLPGLRPPYLSPPMSGSPSPENRFDPLRSGKRRRLSSPPISTSAHGSSEVFAPAAQLAGRASGEGVVINDIHNPQTTQSSVPPGGLAPPFEPFRLQPPLHSRNTLPSRTNPLPPRSTRRAKAHVASACVNCKRKHLGCDSARPCRRCIVAGKESSCVDVTHKRRGRPPLKAEEGPPRYEPTFGHSGQPRDTPQSSTPARYHSHRRNNSSRELRPSTELQTERLADPYLGHGQPPSIPPPNYIPPLVSPVQAVPTSSPPQSGLNRQRQMSGGSFQQAPSPQTQLVSPRSGAEVYGRRYSEGPKPDLFSGEGLRHLRSPTIQQQVTPAPSFLSMPGSSQGLLGQPHSGVVGSRPYPVSAPGPAPVRLPPILPSVTRPDVEVSPRRQSLPATSWSSQPLSQVHGGVDRTQGYGDMHGQHAPPPLQLAPLGATPMERTATAPQPGTYPPMGPQFQPQLQQVSTQPSGGGNDITGPKENNESDNRPAKRQKMALGEMVND